MEGPPLGPGGEDITWPDQVAPRGRKASSTRKIKPQTSNLEKERCSCEAIGIFGRYGSLRLSFMALLCTVDSKTRPVSHTEVHDKTPEMVVNLTRSDTQEEVLKDGF